MTDTATRRTDVPILDLPLYRGRRIHCACGGTFLVDSLRTPWGKRGCDLKCLCFERMRAEVFRPAVVEASEDLTLLRHDEYTPPLYSVRYVNQYGEERVTPLMEESRARGLL